MSSIPETQSNLIPLIDCDVLQYRCGFAADSQLKREAAAAEPNADHERIMEMLQEADYVGIALYNVKEVMEGITDKFKGKYRAFIHGDGNFRDELGTIKEYKANRKNKPKPKYAKEIAEYLVNVWKAEVVDGQESDDALGIAQSQAEPGSTVIVSNDKDMKMIPGYHYNWITDEFVFVSAEEADMMLFWQMLVGDNTDNIPGIDGIGKKRATDLLSKMNSVEEARTAVYNLYCKQYGPEQGPLAYNEVANLLWIRRAPNEACPF